MNNPTLAKKKRNELVTPSRNEFVSDLKIICQVGCFVVPRINWMILFQDGVTFAHQFILGRHSRYLKQLFASSFSVDNVRLVEPKCNGVERRIKVYDAKDRIFNQPCFIDWQIDGEQWAPSSGFQRQDCRPSAESHVHRQCRVAGDYDLQIKKYFC